MQAPSTPSPAPTGGAPAAPQGPTSGQPQTQPAARGIDAKSLHEYAVDAEHNLEQLATGLAQAGVDDQVVQTVSKMADVTRKVIKALGQGQEQTSDAAPPARAQPAPQQPNQPTAAQANDPYGHATAQLHQAAQASGH